MSEGDYSNEMVQDVSNERERLIQKCSRLEAQVSTLKEVSSLRKSLLELREQEVKDLIGKMKVFETVLDNERKSREAFSMRVDAAEKTCVELTSKLQANIEQLTTTKITYEERVGALVSELERSDQECQKRTDDLNESELRNIELNAKVDEYGKLIVDNQNMMKKLQDEMKVVAERNRAFSYQMNLLNTLFNETEGTPIDFERIKAIGDIVRESQNMSCLTEAPSSENPGNNSSRRTSIDFDALMDQVDTDKYTGEIPGEESCYKKVATVEGPQLVLSVSQTFIKLKDLILEKKHLHREIESLKQLNSKLESKVDRQEKRLYIVTTELNKTWNLVAKLKMQHNKLHNSEAVLKYELHEKRKLLERLKSELSKSRQQWVKVRQKHDESANLCQQMRAEFAKRRQPSSQESGAFSDSSSTPSCSSPNEEEEEDMNETETETQVPEETEDDVDLSGIERGFEIEEVDPLEDFVSDLVQEIEAVTSAEVEIEGGNIDSTEEDVFITSRANRLRQLEDASRMLYSRLMATTVQSSALASRLAQLHDHYGSHDIPVPGTNGFPFEALPLEETSDEPGTIAPQLENPNTETLNRALAFPGSLLEAPGGTRAQLPPVNVFTGDADPSQPNRPVMTLTQNAEALIVEMESPALLEELAVSSVESRSPAILQSTMTHIFDPGTNTNYSRPAPITINTNNTETTTMAGPDLSGDSQELQEYDDSGNMSPTGSQDTNSLSRLIIQQVPKRLEILKQENSEMKKRELTLLQEVDEQRNRVETLEEDHKSMTEMLHQEISSKNDVIDKLQNEMADLVSNLQSDKEKLSTFVKMYLQEKSDLEAEKQTATSTNKNCHKCSKKFSLFGRKKYSCKICKHGYCHDCVIKTSSKTNGRKEKICANCSDRKVLMQTAAQSLL